MRVLVALVMFLAWAWPGVSMAERVRLSDALSPQQNYALDLDWQPQDINQMIMSLLSGSAGAAPPLVGYLPAVEVRLDTRQFVGQRVRVYLRMPSAITDPSQTALRLNWEASGDLLSGSVYAGQEALLFEGRLENQVLDGVLNFVVIVEGQGVEESFVIEPIYELEVIQ